MRVRAVRFAALTIALVLPATVLFPSNDASARPVVQAAAQAAAPSFPAGITWLGGATRYDTAVAVSQRYEPGVDAVFVATGTDFPDALSAASAAALLGGPLLLTSPSALPSTVLAEVQRLQPGSIFVVGGASVVSDGVRAALNRVAPTSRLSGADRYATGLAIVRSAFATADHAIIATGRTFPDALAATGAAGSRSAPVILVDGANPTVDARVLAELRRLDVSSVSIAGGPGAVSTGIAAHLSASGYDVVRYGGATRYDTAALINRAYFPAGSASAAFLATGADFPDALAGAALAGHLSAPLSITARNCVHPPVAAAIDDFGAPAHVVLGDTSVVSAAAAANARCVYPITTEPLRGWATSGWNLARNGASAYANRPPIDVSDPSIVLDATGLLVFRQSGTGIRFDHPVDYAQYGISALLEYRRTGAGIWLDRALRHGERLVEMRVERDGAWWYPYRFPWTYLERTLTAPWWSAMAQGEAISLFVHLAEETGDARWDTAAERTWRSFTQPYSSTAPWSTLVIDEHLYLETYAGNQPPLLVTNGHIFAAFGLYDYWRHTGDPAAALAFDGAVTTVAERMMPLTRVEGGVSYYCVQADYCQTPTWQNAHYHVIHSWQLDTLARITGDGRFTSWAAELRADWRP